MNLKFGGRKITLSKYVLQHSPELHRVLRRLDNPKRQPNIGSAGKDKSLERLPARVVHHVTIISMRRKLADAHDNLRTGAKPLADCIASYLGLDDADPAITWEYGQLVTTGPEGTIVKIDSRME